METLFLILKRKWFDKIKAGRKWYEFREATPYWRKRLEGREYASVVFQLGYASDAPRIIRRCTGIQLRSIQGRDVYAIRIKGRNLPNRRRKAPKARRHGNEYVAA